MQTIPFGQLNRPEPCRCRSCSFFSFNHSLKSERAPICNKVILAPAWMSIDQNSPSVIILAKHMWSCKWSKPLHIPTRVCNVVIDWKDHPPPSSLRVLWITPYVSFFVFHRHVSDHVPAEHAPNRETQLRRSSAVSTRSQFRTFSPPHLSIPIPSL